MKFDKIYQDLLYEILNNGSVRQSRNHPTKSIFFYAFTIEDPRSAILTLKSIHFKSVVTELLWFMNGLTNVKYLIDNGCNIWNNDAYQNYRAKYKTPEYCWCKLSPLSDSCNCINLSEEEYINKIKTDENFARVFGFLGPIYGEQWRGWDDQLKTLIKDIKTSPTSRRLIVNSWNIVEIESMTLPPCHYSFQVYVRKEKLDMIVNMRSSDVPLGLPFNVTSYSLLLIILAKLTYKEVGVLNFVLGDAHIYLNQMDAAEKLLKASPVECEPYFSFDGIDFTDLDSFLATATPDNIKIHDYKHAGRLNIPLN